MFFKCFFFSLQITPMCNDTLYHTKSNNFGFDITPARLVTGLITDKGIISPVNIKKSEWKRF